MYKTINSFNQIDLNTKTLVICDIDNTLLYQKSERTLKEIYEIFQKDFDDLPKEEFEKEVKEMYQISKSMAKPKCSDFDGFNNLVKKVNELDGKIIFLTARNSTSSAWTKRQFEIIGINYDNFNVHYTNNSITKGNYIKNNIDTNEYENTIFIDDYESYISTVNEHDKNIICYKFEIEGLDE